MDLHYIKKKEKEILYIQIQKANWDLISVVCHV